MMITAAQLRAARGLLDWTRSELAKASGLSAETIKNIEHGVYAPQESTIAAIVNCFAQNNVEFMENDGVRRNAETVVIFHGPAGFRRFMDDVYESARLPSAQETGDKPIYVSNVDDKLFVDNLSEYATIHTARMNKLKNVKVRVLTGEQNYYVADDSSYIEYRWSGQTANVHVPFYVYGDKFAIIIFKETSEPRIVVISSALVAKTYREQFMILWDNSVDNSNAVKVENK
ncbi:MAG: helix-turn-helix domain-containing protein [Alphaproteobacteria bacterium]|nr:helix-turn-helix domain-containing protein [Alphaproteobacteria bacterium]